MAREGAIEVEAVVVELQRNRIYNVKVTKGHRVVAYVAGRARWDRDCLLPGHRVRLEMSSFDLSAGHIVV